jgi:hypothetical protein
MADESINIGDIQGSSVIIGMVDQAGFLAVVAVYSKAFLETLAKRHADGLAELVNRRFRKNGKNTEAEIGLDGYAAAKIAVTADMPDEARLALLDLDITDDAVRGKLLRWDSRASAWLPDPDQ